MSEEPNESSGAGEWTVRAIGHVSSTRAEAIDDDWGPILATITLVAPLDAQALVGLSAFSHVEVVYLFDQVEPDSVYLGVRRPRNNPDWPEVGVLAQRVKSRPNRLGVSRAELVSVEGAELVVRGLDAIDGTPVLDLKPWMAEFGPRGPVHQPTWATELMAGYW